MMQDHKGNIVIGNGNAGNDKNLLPTVILNPSTDSKVMKEEIFGPILPIITFNNFDEAIKLIRSKDKALCMYYFGKMNSANYKKLERETSSGALVTNEVLF